MALQGLVSFEWVLCRGCGGRFACSNARSVPPWWRCTRCDNLERAAMHVEAQRDCGDADERGADGRRNADKP